MFDDKTQFNSANQNLSPGPPASPSPSPLAPGAAGEAGREPDDIFENVDGGGGGALPSAPVSPALGQPGLQAGGGLVGRMASEGQSGQSALTPVGALPQSSEGPPPGSVAVPQIEIDSGSQRQSIFPPGGAALGSSGIQTMPSAPLGGVRERSLSGGKKVLIIGISVILLVALVGGGYWLYGKFSKPLGAETGSDTNLLTNDTNDTNDTNNLGEGSGVIETEETEETEEAGEGGGGIEGGEGLEQSSYQSQELEVSLDTDGDGLTDEEELTLGTNVNEPDSDRDGLPDRDEVEVYKTNPLNPDTDGDSYFDGDEVEHGYDPKGEGRLLDVP